MDAIDRAERDAEDASAGRAAGSDRAVARAARIARLAARNPRALFGRFTYVFILSHMRAYTSVLAHVLGSHPQVAGYFELHQSYRGPLDLVRMRVSITHGLDGPLRSTHVLDKILHSRHDVDPRILGRDDVFAIFTVRPPLATLRSSLGVARFASDAGAAARYYAERLGWLAAASAVARHRVYLDADALLERTGPVLDALREFLGLGSPLSPRYSGFKFTGVRGYGDTSDAIRRGEIVQDRVTKPSPEIPPDALARAQASFDSARPTLIRNCGSCL